MKRLVLVLVFAASSAYADRSAVMSVGLTLDGRARASTFGDAGDSTVTDLLAGGRVAMSFEDAALPIPAAGTFVSDFRLVPELIAGFVADDTHAEGYVGAGLRAEIDLASNMRLANLRTGIYVAGRGLVLGGHQDGAAELVLGEYLERGTSRTRFGWEGGAWIRPRNDAPASQAKELDVIVSFYVGWR